MNVADRTTHPVQQGTGPWLRLREGFFTASEAPAALGVSKYVTRAELLRRKHTGVPEEPSDATLGKFRAGHAAEAKARPMAEAMVETDLYPVTMSTEVAGLKLLASLDGLTMDELIVWETKLWNEELAEQVRAGNLAPHYTVQLDQELLVSGAERCLFTCTDGTPDRFVSCWYAADPDKFDALLSGWRQFAKDLAAFAMPTPTAAAPSGKSPDTLPALRIEVTGAVTASNLAEFKATALTAIRSVNRDLKTDQDFADADKAVKWCADVESRLKAAKEHALSQTADIDRLFKALDDIGAEAKTVRLNLGRLVDRRKVEVKESAVSTARRAMDAHVADLNGELAPMRLQPVVADFPGAIKGLRSIASMQDALDTTLAAAKIAADAQARVIRANVATFKARADGLEFLFADLGAVVHKAADDFSALVDARVAKHRADDLEREAKRKAAEDARIAAAEAKARADEATRIEREQQARQAAAQAPTTAPHAALVQQSLVPPAPAAAPARSAYTPIVSQSVAATQVPRGLPTLKLGTFCKRLGFPLTADFLRGLGFEPTRDRGALLLHEDDFTSICFRLMDHVQRIATASLKEEVSA